MKICPLCGHRIVLRNGKYCNSTIVDGQLVHKKCPTERKKVLSESETHDFKRLTALIDNYLKQCPRGYIAEHGINWGKTTQLIKKLKNQGYSYSDQMYVLNKVVLQQHGFWGYGAVENNIAVMIGARDRKEKLLEEYEEQQKNEQKKPKRFQEKEDDFEW